MATDWASLAAELSKYQRIHYVTIKAFQSVFNPDSDTAQIVGEDGVAREVPSWRALSSGIARVRADGVMVRAEVNDGQQDGALPMGVYPVRREGATDLLVDFSVALGSARRLQLLAEYGNEIYFRVARDGVDSWQGVGSRKNRMWHSGNDGNFIRQRRDRIDAYDGVTMDNVQPGEMGFNYGTSSDVWGPFLAFGGLGTSKTYGCQFNAAYGHGGSLLRFRTHDGDAKSWNQWFTVWNSGNLDPVTIDTAQVIKGEKSFAGSILSSIAGGAYADWRQRQASIVLSCPMNNSAYAVWRAVQHGTRHLGAFDVHANSSDTGVVSAVMHLAGGGDSTYSHSWTGGNYEAPGVITAGDTIKTGQVNTDMGGSSRSGLEVRNVTNGTGDNETAAMAFHCQGNYAVKLGLRQDGLFGLGGWSAGAWRWSVNAKNGNMTAAGSVTGLSDIRLKTNIHRIDNALGKVKQLGGYTYDRLDTHCRQTGLIAQEVLGVLPEAVIETADDDKTLSVAYGNMAGLFVEAIKELSAQIDFLSHRVIELEGRKQ
ncbi:tail fiber domain-containing protein [Chromobacterium alkanivorans]|uniref:tail fiber domain-containing protein n=1 Tax=Chromobacterium alkanivorans TaxID=1071719 RepID=UPI00196852C2|nr:tail fiber domain-containing protein [Chromobacterium alkanivorans]MBN3003347.1 tail fiber domain-containing protein [Chromobacterium alkanivorans]